VKKKVADLLSENKVHVEETASLRRKLKEHSEQTRKTTLNLSKSSDNLLSLGSSASTYDRLKKYLEDKEVHIFKKVFSKDIQ
jgi:methylthioribose-1-phosphate isomerase